MDLLVALLLLVAFGVAAALWHRRAVTIIYPPSVGLLYRDGRFDPIESTR